jgi:hypothetical protein
MTEMETILGASSAYVLLYKTPFHGNTFSIKLHAYLKGKTCN